MMGLREELRKARAKTRGIVGVNVMVALSNFSDMVRTAISEKADIIFSGAGLPLDLPFRICGRIARRSWFRSSPRPVPPA